VGVASFREYYQYLRFGPGREAEREQLVSLVTNKETYFFREPAQLRAFSTYMLRELKQRKTAQGERTLRVLSAGCATGEEAYTIAMLIRDSAEFFWDWAVEVVGLDVDAVALEKARQGLYQENSFRATPAEARATHFTAEGAAFRVKERLRGRLRWVQGNLLDGAAYDGLGTFDAVFCRNVLMYFSEAAARRVIARLQELLKPGSYLLLGHAESLSRFEHPLEAVRYPGAIAYRKHEAEARAETPPS
jgi:chemotaxis protein methyltransferase CheR